MRWRVPVRARAAGGAGGAGGGGVTRSGACRNADRSNVAEAASGLGGHGASSTASIRPAASAAGAAHQVSACIHARTWSRSSPRDVYTSARTPVALSSSPAMCRMSWALPITRAPGSWIMKSDAAAMRSVEPPMAMSEAMEAARPSTRTSTGAPCDRSVL